MNQEPIIFQFDGYSGSAEISILDNCLCGKILGIKDVVTYEGKSPMSLETAFKSAVLDYKKTLRNEYLNAIIPIINSTLRNLDNRLCEMEKQMGITRP